MAGHRDALIGIAALALAATPATAEDVKIGALMAMTGDLQVFGEADYKGIELAVEQVNEAGGVLGSNVVIEVGDTQTAAQPAIDAAQKLVSVAGVAGVIGALSSGNTIPVATSVTSTAGVPQISNASTSPVITNLEDNDFLFRTVPSDAFTGVALAEVTRDHGYNKVAVFYVNNDYGEGLADSFGKSFAVQAAKSPARYPTSRRRPRTAASSSSSRRAAPRAWC